MTSFGQPTRDDFLRILAGISEDARATAESKALEIQTTFVKAGGISNGRYPITLAAELLTIHKAGVDRAMEFIAKFAAQSALSLNELCDAARECLIRRLVVFSAPVLRAMKIPGDAAHEAAAARERRPFESQIDEAIKNLKIGFVSDRSVAMNPADTVQARALRLLRQSTNRPVRARSLCSSINLVGSWASTSTMSVRRGAI